MPRPVIEPLQCDPGYERFILNRTAARQRGGMPPSGRVRAQTVHVHRSVSRHRVAFEHHGFEISRRVIERAVLKCPLADKASMASGGGK